MRYTTDQIVTAANENEFRAVCMIIANDHGGKWTDYRTQAFLKGEAEGQKLISDWAEENSADLSASEKAELEGNATLATILKDFDQ